MAISFPLLVHDMFIPDVPWRAYTIQIACGFYWPSLPRIKSTTSRLNSWGFSACTVRNIGNYNIYKQIRLPQWPASSSSSRALGKKVFKTGVLCLLIYLQSIKLIWLMEREGTCLLLEPLTTRVPPAQERSPGSYGNEPSAEIESFRIDSGT